MTALPGAPLGAGPLSPDQLDAVAIALDRLHTSVPRRVLDGVPVRHEHPARVAADLADRLRREPEPDDDVAARAYDEALRWLPSATRSASDEGTVVLGRGDHNLSNFLWDGQDVRLVDFEYAGRSDLATELAELVEHLSARCTPDRQWQQLVDDMTLSRAERRRFLAMRRVQAITWLLLLLPGQRGADRNPPGTLRRQARRTLDLLDGGWG